MTQNSKEAADPAQMIQRWLPVAGGGALALLGLARRSSVGDAALVLAGGALLAFSLRQMDQSARPRSGAAGAGGGSQVSVPHKQGIRVDKAFTIGKPRQELYDFWHDLSNLPRFMKHLKSVEVRDEKRSHWVASAPAGQEVAWEAEIINDVPGELLAWRSVEGSQISNAGTVTFKDAPGGRGTEVRVELLYDAPGGLVGSALAKVFGEEPAQQVENDLRRLKQQMEAGEEPTTEGQSSGSRSKPGLSIGPRIS